MEASFRRLRVCVCCSLEYLCTGRAQSPVFSQGGQRENAPLLISEIGTIRFVNGIEHQHAVRYMARDPGHRIGVEAVSNCSVSYVGDDELDLGSREHVLTDLTPVFHFFFHGVLSRREGLEVLVADVALSRFERGRLESARFAVARVNPGEREFPLTSSSNHRGRSVPALLVLTVPEGDEHLVFLRESCRATLSLVASAPKQAPAPSRQRPGSGCVERATVCDE